MQVNTQVMTMMMLSWQNYKIWDNQTCLLADLFVLSLVVLNAMVDCITDVSPPLIMISHLKKYRLQTPEVVQDKL